jgi:aldose sugar dehydrogenase
MHHTALVETAVNVRWLSVISSKSLQTKVMNSRALIALITMTSGLTLAACVTMGSAQMNSAKVETVKDGLERPWSLNFAPDGRLLFTQKASAKLSSLDLKTGTVKVLGTVAGVRSDGEGGLMGLELAPDFAQNKQLFVCYSYFKGQSNTENRRNRLSRFTLSGSGLEAEKILFDDMLGWSNHNGCRITIGPDQKLYFTMGDAANFPPGPTKAQDKNVLAGKTFRLNLDGSIPTDNPFFSSSSGQARAVWSFGHRNQQGLAFQPGTGVLWSTEHGWNSRDELNIIKKGKNYGWPYCAGTQVYGVSERVAADGTYPCVGEGLSQSNYQPAIKAYEPDFTVAMSDMVFYTGIQFPKWKNNLFFVTLKTGRIYRLELEGEKVVNEEILIDGQYGRLRAITQGPDGFLYFSSDAGDGSSIYRIKPQ